MNIEAKYFGNISYEQGDVVYIEGGLFGFEEFTRFLPIPFQEEDDSVLSLQSLEDPELSFILMNPFTLFSDYNPKLSDGELASLSTENEEDLSFYVISVIRDTAAESTVNLKAPVVINAPARTGRQIILSQPEYTFRHPLSDFQNKEV